MNQEEIIQHNLDILLRAKDFRPRYSTIAKFQTDYTAKCQTGKHVLKTGLGFQGIGSMWFHTPESMDKDLFDSLPIAKCSAFGISDPCE